MVETAHASLFTSVINGTAIAGYTESASCAPCHRLAYDANNSVNDGGFSALMTQLNWNFPTTGQAGNWAACPPPCRTWPTSSARTATDPAASTPTTVATRLPFRYPPTPGPAASATMNRATTSRAPHGPTPCTPSPRRDPVGNATCVGCHTGTGFTTRMSGGTITDTTYHPIDCAACHEPHGFTATCQRFTPDSQHGVGDTGRWHQGHRPPERASSACSATKPA